MNEALIEAGGTRIRPILMTGDLQPIGPLVPFVIWSR